MDLPTPRELELETLLRQRDAQVAELTDEVTHLRQFLTNQPPPSATEPITIPPALMSVLLPHLNQRPHTPAAASGSVTTALIQRAKILQEENDELYELLKTGETGRLKEDVRVLRRVVQKLEGALRGASLPVSPTKYDVQAAGSPQNPTKSSHPYPPRSTSPRTRSSTPKGVKSCPPRRLGAPPAPSANGSGKLPPTGPRAHKKPRLSDMQKSPTGPSPPLPIPTKPHLSAANATVPRGGSRDSRVSMDRKVSTGEGNGAGVGGGMDVDDDSRSSRPRSPARERDRPPHRDRDREKDRDRDREHTRNRDREREKDRDHDHERSSRRRRRGGQRNGKDPSLNPNNIELGDRDQSLAARMGL
ncbi:uncharacterized protein BXZ73DRAFT_97547 [Epithele typhae]|uniref:uncharacterized protein n=1 Tax=Epithele typhae TaxID=378194 RepID=UPI0020087EC1|nr:uncharacterized protein BXZ73DRAFT_97547 [Epithele typhae]KAH9943508.1 hypothetical protein BXZ73DRAFT_97547 [Epithele typhae]